MNFSYLFISLTVTIHVLYLQSQRNCVQIQVGIYIRRFCQKKNCCWWWWWWRLCSGGLTKINKPSNQLNNQCKGLKWCWRSNPIFLFFWKKNTNSFSVLLLNAYNYYIIILRGSCSFYAYIVYFYTLFVPTHPPELRWWCWWRRYGCADISF